MSEVIPSLTYSPEGELTLTHVFDEYDEPYKDQIAVLNVETDSLDGYQVVSDDVSMTVKIDVQKVVRVKDDDYETNQAAQSLLKNIQPFVGMAGFQQPTDYLFSLDYWGGRGPGGVIFPSMQRWLNSGNLTEQVARDSVEAMAYVFGEMGQQAYKKYFRYETDGKNVRGGCGGFSMDVISRRDDFGIIVVDESEEVPVYRNGRAAWNWPNLSTIGNCACWGVNGDDRDRVYITSGSKRLYEMQPHNVDTASQSLSLVLGMAVLAHAAENYDGTEDILENIVWAENK